jgi:membrane-associated phospholipid phosphatase
MIFRICLIFTMASFMPEVQAQNPDIKLLRDINLNRSKSLDKTFNVFTNSAAPVSFAAPVIFWGIGKITGNEKFEQQGVISGSALVLTLSVSYLTKYTVNRTRPYKAYPDIQAFSRDNSPSFPSNHTSVAFSAATSLSLAFPKWYVIVPSYAWASAVGYSRLHLGEHYPSDVLAGAIIGSASAFVCYKLNNWIMQKYHRIF